MDELRLGLPLVLIGASLILIGVALVIATKKRK